MRWLVLVSLVYAVYRAYTGFKSNAPFTKTDDAVRHWTATIAHVQLLIGILVYTQSPIIKYFWRNSSAAIHQRDTTFFALIHVFLMIMAIVVLTIGSALAKRQDTDQHKFRTMLIWFSLALIIIFIAVPWPFSPLANRVYFRPL
jgi:cytochrome bd-type quinol oxidase subunit 2